MTRVLWALVSLAACSGASAGTDRREPETVTDPPTAIIDLGPSAEVLSAAFSADGRLYIRAASGTVDWLGWLWWWPETVGVSATLVVASAARLLRRVPTPRCGDVCCGCGYIIRGVRSPRCPECGLDDADRQRLAERRRRLRMLAGRVAVIAVATAVIAFGRELFPASLRYGLPMWRTLAGGLAEPGPLGRLGLDPDRWQETCEVLLEASPDTGEILRVLSIQAPGDSSLWKSETVVSSDGRQLYTLDGYLGRWDTQRGFDLETGRPLPSWMVARAPLPRSLRGARHQPAERWRFWPSNTSPDGNWLIGSDRTFCPAVMDIFERSALRFPKEGFPETVAALSPGARKMAAGRLRFVKIYDLSTKLPSRHG